MGYEIRLIAGKSNNPKNEYYQIKRLLSNQSNPIIFDVGANIGKISTTYRSIFPNAKIYAFEPIAECYDKLKILSNRDKNLYPYPIAISNKNEKREFFINQNLGSSSLLTSNSKGKEVWGNRALDTVSTTDVECKTLDSFCIENDIKRINLVKLDIQGSELNALHGAEKLLKEGKIDMIYTEISIYKSYNGQAEFHQILSYLKEYHFTLFNIYKSIHKNGRLLEIDILFVTSALLSRQNDTMDNSMNSRSV